MWGWSGYEMVHGGRATCRNWTCREKVVKSTSVWQKKGDNMDKRKKLTTFGGFLGKQRENWSTWNGESRKDNVAKGYRGQTVEDLELWWKHACIYEWAYIPLLKIDLIYLALVTLPLNNCFKTISWTQVLCELWNDWMVLKPSLIREAPNFTAY